MSEPRTREARRARGFRFRPKVRQSGSATHATWLTDRLLLLVGEFGGMDCGALEAEAITDGQPLGVEARGLSYSRRNGDGETWGLVIARFPQDAVPTGEWPTLEIAADGTRLTLTPGDLAEAETEVKTLLRRELAALDEDVRADLIQFLATCLEPGAGPGDDALSKELHLIREALRERLPYCVVSAEEPRGFQLDEILAVDDSLFWVKGWLRDEGPRTELVLVSPEGARADTLDGAFRHARPDVAQFYANLGDLDPREKLGLISRVQLPAPSRLSKGWIGELRSSQGSPLETAGPEVVRDLDEIRDTILADLVQEKPLGGSLTVDHAYPAIARLQERVKAAAEIESVDEYGDPPRSVEVTLVVPLYKRTDFVEHQLLQFTKDPDLARVDLVYVLDSPELADSLAQDARQLFALYELPFRLVTMSRNSGFAAANNAGASVARGRLLVLLNSDVIPDRPGWLSTMRDFYERTPEIGALGPKLLYEDDSLQHAGLYFYRAPGSSIWENSHCFKGLHRTLPAANVARPVPAVTAACMMIERELYERLGGLSGRYVRGDYEDSELCLRLGEQGRQSWYLPDAELYHLEAQSYTPDLRRVASQYNMWLHTHLWNDQVGAAMADFDPHLAQTAQPRPDATRKPTLGTAMRGSRRTARKA